LAPELPALRSLFAPLAPLLGAAVAAMARDAELADALRVPLDALLGLLDDGGGGERGAEAWAAWLAPGAASPQHVFLARFLGRALELGALRRAYAQCAGEAEAAACACALAACGAAKRALRGAGASPLLAYAKAAGRGEGGLLGRVAEAAAAALKERSPPVGGGVGSKRAREGE
jgi:hypothetical protein